MLKLKNIVKNYYVADITVEALKNVNLCFRKNEFVSILGPSGCGKTTLLNIIGGLDKYTSGDLCISGTSTKEFGDREWDVYRNHRIGFIFQSYNLIPHQTILGNVELALTISGIGKAERQERAKKALDKVGLAGQYNKKPNQLSGGQCQRVAIARALVNEPEILLADEPTGALDTVTSVQIMDLIKEIAQEKLVIMVTHNPELAEKYSTRIVRLLDGEVIEDSNPYSEEDELKEIEEINEKEKAQYEILTEEEKKAVKKQKNRAKMSFFTAFKLSAYRPNCPIIAITVNAKACRQLNLAWNVYPVYAEHKNSTDELFLYAIEKALATGIVKKGDRVIITGASGIGDCITDTIKLHII